MLAEETGKIRVNRAPVLTLWAAVVAERLGYGPDTAITLGRAVAGSSARIKARAIGLAEAKQEGDGLHEAAKGTAPAKTVRLLGRDVPVAEGNDGLRALDQSHLAAPGPPRAYVEHALGAHLPAVRQAMEGVVQNRVTREAGLALSGAMMAPCRFQVRCEMDRCAGAAARLPKSDRKDPAIQALARSETVSGLAARHGVSRKFVYQQTHKARAALVDAFSPATPNNEVLFELAVTKAWLRQVIVGLTLICRSSYRGVVEFLRNLLGVPVSVGCVHAVLQAATRQASAVNHGQDLSDIRGGLHDEIFQGATPVLAGVDAASTYCYILAAEQRRDADTWGVHLLDAAERGLRPNYTIADAGQGLRAGQKAAWGDTPRHGDVFHIQRQCEGLANALSRLAQGAVSRRKMLQARIGCTGQRAPDHELAAQRTLARQAETQAHELAHDIRTLTQWLSHDIPALVGPALATRRELFDFIVAEFAAREPGDARRIRPGPACSSPAPRRSASHAPVVA